MALISGEFLAFCLLLTIVYYLVPGRFQNALLLAANVIFLLPLGSFPIALGFLTASIVSVYAAARFIGPRRGSASARCIYLLTVLLNLGFLFAFKYLPCSQNVLSALHIPVSVPDLSAIAPLGISFYTLQLLGYLISVNDGGLEPERSFLRFAVFGSFFPQITSGPISRYEELASQFSSRRSFSYENLTRGSQRILWGFFKKLVISERAAVPVNTIFGNYGLYNGFYIPVAAILFAFQLYCDFSGCMDIVIGMAEVLGITLPDNFTSPFFSRSMTEFWRRWHITLGTWCKDYVFYPIQKSELFYRIREKSIRRFGRKKGKKVPMYLACSSCGLSLASGTAVFSNTSSAPAFCTSATYSLSRRALLYGTGATGFFIFTPNPQDTLPFNGFVPFFLSAAALFSSVQTALRPRFTCIALSGPGIYPSFP